MIPLTLANADEIVWAQSQVAQHHYLRRPVDSRCSVLGYIAWYGDERRGCLLFGRPESTRCFDGALTYGSQSEVRAGRARYDRWELVNLARVWLAPQLQYGGRTYVPNAATWAIGQALRRVVVDYLLAYPPCFVDEPWRLRVCLSYCDTRLHRGTRYRAAGFTRARINAAGIETWMRPLRGLQGHERQAIERGALPSFRSRTYRAMRRSAASQLALIHDEGH